MIFADVLSKREELRHNARAARDIWTPVSGLHVAAVISARTEFHMQSAEVRADLGGKL